jgi:hypothetical protein
MIRPCFISPCVIKPSLHHIGSKRIASSLSLSKSALSTTHHSVLDYPTTLLADVKVFDGSEITNTVVVSNNFWSTLASKLPYLIAAEVLAAIAFVAIASVVASQSKFVVDKATTNNSQKNGNQFYRANDPPPQPLDFTKLFLCIVIDIIGSSNEAIPLVGELVDIIYAPIAALLLRQLFNGSNIVALLEFTEEILPFTDILPLATICWVVESFFCEGNLARILRIGKFAPDRDFVDVDATTARLNMEDREELQLPRKLSDERDNKR